MYVQQRYLKQASAFDSTKCLQTIELPQSGLLSGIEFSVWGTCGAGGDKPDVWLHDRLTKIELIVNGSKVVKSLSGDQLLADMLYKRTPLFSHDMKNMVAASCEEFFYINLGRHYHDPEFALDLSRVTDPELRISADFTLAAQNGWTNGVAMSAAPSFSVVPHIIRDPALTPRGYIKTSEVYRFTSGVSKKENMKIPKGPTYSNLYLQSWYKAQGLGYLLDAAELNMNNDALIPLRVGANELAAENARQYGLFTISQQMSVKGGQAYPHPLEQGVLVAVQVGLTDAEAGQIDLWGNASPFGFRKTSDGVTPVTGNVNINATEVGVFPFSVAAIPMFNPWDESTWINSQELGDFWLRVEENASGSTSAVIKLLADEVVSKYE